MAAIDETGMNARDIELEVTESMMMRDPEEAVKLLRKLKAVGVRITIDDFGTGYSSLAYLKRLPIDCVKIDASFVRGIPVDASDVAITETVIAMSRGLGLKVVAEGVENRDQMRFLEARGCDEMQGFYFSKPLPAEHVPAYLRQEPLPEERAREAQHGLKVVGGKDRRGGT
jgi:EAL domain-containing protein (putative c-di-GMP-specific phosphodiesterase class I)